MKHKLLSVAITILIYFTWMWIVATLMTKIFGPTPRTVGRIPELQNEKTYKHE